MNIQRVRRSLLAGLSAIIFVVIHLAPAYARGQGPIGLWPVSARYALVADTSLPGLALVDLETGVTIERLLMNRMRPVGIASCQDCNFVLISSGSQGRFWLLRLPDTTTELIQKTGKLNLDRAHLEPLEISTKDGALVDGRMSLVSDDGKTAFIASSQDHALFRVDFSKTPNAVALLKDKNLEPFGVNWDSQGGLLVSMHKREVWRITTEGKVLGIYDTKTADCPGTRELNPNLRAAIDDPVNKQSLLILASNPRSYDAVVWRLSVDPQGKQTCTHVAGKIGRDTGWIDGTGELIEFSRPHYFSPRPETQPPQVIITDIDNRALRLLDLTTYSSSSVMYNRDHTLSSVPLEQRTSKTACTELQWPASGASFAQNGTQFCMQPDKNRATEMSLTEAKAHCSALGARLCEPAELISAGLPPAAKVWSAAECASCWQRGAGERCAVNIAENKTADIQHNHKDFTQSWHSGQALALGKVAARPAGVFCTLVTDNLRASVACCADQKSSPRMLKGPE